MAYVAIADRDHEADHHDPTGWTEGGTLSADSRYYLSDSWALIIAGRTSKNVV